MMKLWIFFAENQIQPNVYIVTSIFIIKIHSLQQRSDPFQSISAMFIDLGLIYSKFCRNLLISSLSLSCSKQIFAQYTLATTPFRSISAWIRWYFLELSSFDWNRSILFEIGWLRMDSVKLLHIDFTNLFKKIEIWNF